MGWLWYPVAIALNTVVLALVVNAGWPELVLAPDVVEAHPLLRQQKRARSLPQLQRLQQRIDERIEQLPSLRLINDMPPLREYHTLAQIAFRVDRQVRLEETADAHYARALQLAAQGIQARDRARASGYETLEELQQQAFFWKAAIAQLDQVPERSLLAQRAEAKQAEYRQILAPVAVELDARQSEFLADIAAETGRPEAIRITLCHLSGECRNFQGNVPPASPASLIKVPVAVALMDKVHEEAIDLDTQIYIDPRNWTENANGAKIYVRHEYPLREVMARMIKESNNIATNQLADYIGWEAINETLEERGFTHTTVNTKLAGDRTLPTYNRNSGQGANTMTTNEVTEMMRQIYTFAHPGDREILDALVGQYDWDFGYRAVNELRSPRVAWIGEKTGQNSKVIGSSLAVKIDDQRYVMTVTIDHSANQRMLRQVIQAVIQHILDEGHLVFTR